MKVATPAQVPPLPKREGEELNKTLALDLVGSEAKADEQPELGKRGLLRLTNGYAVKFDQIARLLALTSTETRRNTPTREIAAAIGVSDVHARFLGSIAVGLGLAHAKTFKPTELGRLVIEHDTFFDDLGTLWFLHYIIASEPNFIIWNRFANVLMPRQCTFTAKEFQGEFEHLRLIFSATSNEFYVPKETRTILDAYTNQQFSRLAYLRKRDNGYGPGYREPVPVAVLAASITRFRDRHQAGNTAVSVRDLISAPNSPGVVFQMHEDVLRAGLEQLRHGYGFSLEARADLDQLRFAQDIPEHIRMERYYAGR